MFKKIWKRSCNTFINTYLIYVLLVGFFVCISALVTWKHYNFYTYGFDLWIFDQVVWQYSQWNFPAASSIRDIDNILWDHFHPILMLYAWVYKIYSSALVLLYIQNLAFVLWWLALYKIAKYFKLSSVFGLGIVLIYLLFEGNISALLFDFHPMVVGVSLLPWLVYLGLNPSPNPLPGKEEKKSYYLYFILLSFILLSKENMSLYVVFLWIFQLFFKQSRRIGIVSILIGGVYFYLVMNYFIPAMWWNSGSYWSYTAVWDSPWDMIKNIFLQPGLFIDTLFGFPEKLITYTKHLASGWIFMLFTPAIFLIIPGYAQKFLSHRTEFWTMDQFHYSIDISWALLIGAILFFAYFQKIISRRGRISSSLTIYMWKYSPLTMQVWKYSPLTVIQITFIIIAVWINIYYSPLRNISYTSENKEIIREYISIIPRDASISTQNSIIPHVSHRDKVYLFPQVEWAEYIVLEEFSKDGWPLESRGEFERIFSGILNKQEISNISLPYIKERLDIRDTYELLKQKNNVYLFKKIKK